ncbi:hypothetical protein [Bradyrhizobium sp. USDA 3315]
MKRWIFSVAALLLVAAGFGLFSYSSRPYHNMPKPRASAPGDAATRFPPTFEKGGGWHFGIPSRDSDEKCRQNNRALGVVATPNAPCIELEDIVAKLKRGTYKFNKPGSAALNEVFTMRLALLTADGQTASFDALPGTVTTRSDKHFAQSIEATLSGDDFEITPPGPQARTATRVEPVEWEWKVKPLSAGIKSVTVDVFANISVGADKSRVQVTTLSEEIEIDVTVFQRIRTFVADSSWIAASAVAIGSSAAALIGFIPTLRKFFKENVSLLVRRRKRMTRSKRGS